MRIEKQIEEAETLFGVLRKKILIYQQEVETYLEAVNSNENYSSMNKKVKDLVRNKLFKLKNQQNVLSELNNKIRLLKKKQFPKESQTALITVQEFIDPIVKIKFNAQELEIKEKAPGRRVYKLIDGVITNI